jgi:protein arginine kinase activator
MLCEYCGVREAEVEFIDASREGIKKYHLCRICADKLAANPELIRLKGRPNKRESTLRDETSYICPVCGWSISDYHRTGKLGCANCYFTFREAVREELQALEETNRYDGEPYRRNKTKFIMFGEFVSLKQQIEIAVAEEDFERAAQLSERLKTLKGKLANENS